ncbi:hypothetical protein M2103_001312 [Ereboglobus sp. PH5-5]|nr:hypothetical protein [Ereboglobus sp. PH5-5]
MNYSQTLLDSLWGLILTENMVDAEGLEPPTLSV